MRNGLRRLLEERKKRRRQVVEEARRALGVLRRELGKVTFLLYGSFSRGDFNVWSDIDVLVVSKRFEVLRPLDRLSLAQRLLPPGFEPKCLTPQEAIHAFKKPWWRKVLREAVILADDYGLLTDS